MLSLPCIRKAIGMLTMSVALLARDALCWTLQPDPYNTVAYFSSYGPTRSRNATKAATQVGGPLYALACPCLWSDSDIRALMAACAAIQASEFYTLMLSPQDVRLKPEILAPGRLRSALSDGEYTGVMDSCGTQWMHGRSQVPQGNSAEEGHAVLHH
jgi:hypothetical protein